MSGGGLTFNSTNQKATNTLSTINDLSIAYRSYTIDTQTDNSNSYIFSYLIKYLGFYSSNTISRIELGTVLNNERIPSIYDVWPDISYANSSNNLNVILNDCSGTIFHKNDSMILSNQFTIDFLNKDVKYSIDLSGSNISNYLFFIYNVKNEIITITENNSNDSLNINNAPIFSNALPPGPDQLISHRLVNAISLTNSNVNVILIDGTSIDVIYNNLPKINASAESSNNTSILLRDSSGVKINHQQNIFNSNFNINLSRNGESAAVFKVHANDITNINKNLIVYIYNSYDLDITFNAYDSTNPNAIPIPKSENNIISNQIGSILNYTDYSILLINGTILWTAPQQKIEDIFNKYTYYFIGNNNFNKSIIDSYNCNINLVL